MGMNYGLIKPDEWRFCETCKGSGWEPDGICHVCDGWGWVALTAMEVTRAIAHSYVDSLKLASRITKYYSEQFAQ